MESNLRITLTPKKVFNTGKAQSYSVILMLNMSNNAIFLVFESINWSVECFLKFIFDVRIKSENN